MRSAVDLPQPRGPDEHQKLAVGNFEVERADRGIAVGIALADPLEYEWTP